MPEEPYKNREIKELFSAADERADAFHDKLMERMGVFEDNTTGALERIEEQTKKTNGSVAALNKWRERMNGIIIASGAFMSVIVIPILAWALYVLVNINNTVHMAVDQALSAYNIQK